MGMEVPIPTTGIFPPSSCPTPEAEGDPPEIDPQWREGFDQYPSVRSNGRKAFREFKRYLDKRIAVKVQKSHLKTRFSRGHLNKAGLIIKEKKDGTEKVRIIIDMKRSRANSRASILERPMLPRPLDPVNDVFSILGERETISAETKDDFDVEWAGADFADAYCHLHVHPDELHNCLVACPPDPDAGHDEEEVAVMCRLGFGSKGAPLGWSRIAAGNGRMTQSMLTGAKQRQTPAGRINTYLDDPLISLVGSALQR